MSLKHALKMSALRLGLEVRRYSFKESEEARLFGLLQQRNIDTVIDVGANNGGYGKRLRRGGYSGSIISFEPLEQEHAKLKVAANGDRRWFIAPRMALGNESGEIDIYIAGNSASSSILPMNHRHEMAAPESKYIGTQKVPLFRLDDVQHPAIRLGANILLKIDTQGYEMAVLRGAENLLSKIAGLQLELSLIKLYDGQILYLEMIQWLRAVGFELWSVMPGFVDPLTARMLQFDGIFFRSGD